MTPPSQLTADDIKTMTPAAIEAACIDGRLARLLGDPTGGAITMSQLSRMSTADIDRAQAAGRLDHLLNPTTTEETAS